MCRIRKRIRDNLREDLAQGETVTGEEIKAHMSGNAPPSKERMDMDEGLVSQQEILYSLYRNRIS